MASHKISTTNRGFTRHNAGFTLIEMLVVIGLIAIIGSAFLFIDLNTFRNDSFRAERDTIVTLLGQARVEALNNVSEEPHGIAFFPSDAPESYVLFAGNTYVPGAASNQYYPANYKITLAPGAPTSIVFEQLNGNSNYSGTITLLDPNRAFSSDITINHEGGLSW